MTYLEGKNKPIRELTQEDVRSMLQDCPDDMIPTLRNILILKAHAKIGI